MKFRDSHKGVRADGGTINKSGLDLARVDDALGRKSVVMTEVHSYRTM